MKIFNNLPIHNRVSYGTYNSGLTNNIQCSTPDIPQDSFCKSEISRKEPQIFFGEGQLSRLQKLLKNKFPNLSVQFPNLVEKLEVLNVKTFKMTNKRSAILGAQDTTKAYASKDGNVINFDVYNDKKQIMQSISCNQENGEMIIKEYGENKNNRPYLKTMYTIDDKGLTKVKHYRTLAYGYSDYDGDKVKFDGLILDKPPVACDMNMNFRYHVPTEKYPNAYLSVDMGDDFKAFCSKMGDKKVAYKLVPQERKSVKGPEPGKKIMDLSRADLSNYEKSFFNNDMKAILDLIF